METIKDLGGGLTPLPKDDRDFLFGAAFGVPSLEELPKSFKVVEPLVITDQGSSDLCTAFATTNSSWRQEGEPLSPGYSFQKTKLLLGDYKSWGADLRTACKVHVKFGGLPIRSAPYALSRNGRDTVSNPDNWGPQYDVLAAPHRKKAYFKVSGPYDMFDNIRATLWLNRGERRTVVAGIKWRQSWTKNAKIPESGYEDDGFGHAFEVVGWDGEYLIAPLTNGNKIGDKGVFYIPRNVVNLEFNYGAYTFKDLSPKEVQEVLDRDVIRPKWSLWDWIKSWFGFA